MADDLTKKDKQRLRARTEMVDAGQRAWRVLNIDAADRGRTALQLLTR